MQFNEEHVPRWVVLPFVTVHLRGQKPRPEGYPVSPQSFAEHFRRRRMDLGLFQKQVAHRLGVRVETIGEWEKGRCEPSAGRWPAVLDYLGGHDPYGVPESFSDALDAIRRCNGWELQELAQHLGVSTSTLSEWRAGGMPWSRGSRAAVAGLLARHGFAGFGESLWQRDYGSGR